MNDTPGWASPGSAPSDGQPDGQPSGEDHAVPRPAEPADPQDTAQDKWSKQQPPAGQWSAPGVPGQQPTPGPQQWGGPTAPPGRGPGWGGGWNAPPAAAKPGVIPLRPLGVGEILDGAVSTMRAHWRTVLGISLTVAVITEIVAILLQGFVLNSGASTEVLEDPNATASELLSATGTVMRDSGVLLLLSLLATFVVTALLTMVTSRAVLGKSVTIGEAWHDARPQVPRLLGLTFLLPLIGAGIVAVGTLPGILVAVAGSSEGGATLAVLGGLAALVVAIWLLVRFSLSSPALMLEKQTVRKSLSRSAKLVNGSWWRVFGIQLLAAILVNIVVSIIVIPFSFLAGALSGEGIGGFLEAGGDAGWTFLIITGIGSVVGSMLAFPITAGVSVLLYIDLRIRREALDLELARAAGLQQSGPGTSGQQPGS
ncbi:glycerophosphoryl diester phosphodiesterase membrane domain-containing protein [Streptomyces sp. N35]|uniref:glycerophosphoryl diester phosphodiesterase membrane domain-containing protein n=1 Tax=Streptomyces sp. N35 TaxID=2795730 RepID=UPI0018F78DFD|nr:glycerophosphoryl diester phosphodiesterase membrane domain-containing protein [Streptomyces sp. N35]